MYIQADVKVGEDFGVKVGDDVLILNGDTVLPISLLESNNTTIEDISGDSTSDDNSMILTISEEVWSEAVGLQNKLTTAARSSKEIAAQGGTNV